MEPEFATVPEALHLPDGEARTLEREALVLKPKRHGFNLNSAVEERFLGFETARTPSLPSKLSGEQKRRHPARIRALRV